MIVLVLEDAKYPMDDFISNIRDRTPDMSTMKLTRDDCFSRLKVLSAPPLLSSTWLVIVNSSIPVGFLKEIHEQELPVVTLVRFTSKVKLSKMEEQLSHYQIPYKMHNSVNVKPEVLIKTVSSSLGISLQLAEKICKGTRFSKKLVHENIIKLSQYKGRIDESIINKHMIKSNPVPLFYIHLAMVGYRFDRFNYKGVVKVLHSYYRGHKFMRRYFTKNLKLTIKVFDLVKDGTLSKVTINDILAKNKDLDSLGAFNVSKLIELESYTSKEFLLYLLKYMDSIPNSNMTLLYLLDMIRHVQNVK